MAGEKTEKATPKKRRDQRKEGNVFQSKDVVMVISLLGSFCCLQLLFPLIYRTLRDCLVQFIGYAGTVKELSQGDVPKLGFQAGLVVVKGALPILLIGCALAVLATGIQTRFLFASKAFKPKFSNMNPLNGIKNLFSMKNLVEILKGIVKIILLGVILYHMLKGEFFRLINTMYMDLSLSTVYVLKKIMSMVLQVCMYFAAVAALDYFYQWWSYEKKIKMSKDEIKEEYKQLEGNPEIKGRIKDVQRQRARSRMMQAVPQADVIIRNPTHYAVALKYDPNRDNAPHLIAKGQDELALRIVRVGEEHEVVVIENKPLARGIYASTPLGAEIPGEYYGVVAEILVQVYKLKNRKLV
ncbi:MAG: flagellar biosynthesis protein FlhB [Lachnospiraceae bacterium]|nr:flagellar biosynthesis protein FlhB [Lachnospiraceae bacterium]